jgi:phosphopantothenoylcysteine decarboxylase/phosphopantothenate--cysteine ligase
VPGPRVLLAVSGSIAAYKACEVVRRLQDRGVDVRVVMTPNAARFVSPLTFAALSGHRVLTSSFDDPEPERIPHVRWAEESDVFCVAPGSADFIAKMALGIADDLASTLHLAFDGPVVVAPAMEDQMWLHAAVQSNVETLRARGARLVEPSTGPLASGRYGPGRLADPPVIVDAVMASIAAAGASQPLGGVRVLVSAGPTREHFDPVRVFTNPSTGKMGYAVAEAARQLGAEVALVSGPTAIEPPRGVDVVPVVDAEQMRDEMVKRTPGADVVVMAAAVSDFRPLERASDKLAKRGGGGMSLQMERTPDILAEIVALPGERTVVGFAAETSDLEARAREKMERKGCDLIVGNVVGRAGSGFAADDNEVVILDRRGGRREVGPASKSQIATALLEAVVDFRASLRAEQPGKAV